MAKSSFINKKVLIFMIFIVIAIGVGVAVYMLTRPKADLEAPYNNVYDLSTNENYLQVQKYHSIISEYLNDCDVNISEEQANTNQIDKTEIKLTINKYSVVSNLNNVYNYVNLNMLQNIAFATDTDGKMVEVQQKMTESYNSVLEKLSNCVSHINTYLTEHKVENKALTQVYREIANYTVFYFEYLTELSNFYDYAGQIFKNYLVPSFDVNPISKQNMQTVTVWAKEIITNLVNYNAEFCSIETLKTSTSKLSTFTVSNILQANYYSSKKEAYNATLKCFDNLDATELIKAVARLNHSVFIEGLESDEQKTNATTLCNNYFGVN